MRQERGPLKDVGSSDSPPEVSSEGIALPPWLLATLEFSEAQILLLLSGMFLSLTLLA